MSHYANSSFSASSHGLIGAESYLHTATLENLASASLGRVSASRGTLDGWPSNDVPLVVMYSADLQNLTAMRRLTQAIGIRFLGYDRSATLLDALSVLSPVVVVIDEQDSHTAYRLARQILACDYGMTLVRLVDGSETLDHNSRKQQAVGSDSDAVDIDGPFSGKIERSVSADRLSVSLGRLGVLPRRLAVVKG